MSSIGSIGGYGSMMMSGMQGMRGMPRPSPTEMAENTFSALDSSGKGYIEQSDLESAFASIGSSADTSEVEDLFAQLDGDSDGKVTEDEFTSAMEKLASQLDDQFNRMRVEGGMAQMGGMGATPPPPPPGGAEDAGFTEEELTSQLEEIGSSDSKRSSLISSILENFDAADADGDGKVNMEEAMAFEQANASSSATSTSSGDASSASGEETRFMVQMMRLMQAYDMFGNGESGNRSMLSVTA